MITNRDPGDETRYLDGGPEDILKDVRVQNALGNKVFCPVCDEPVSDADWCDDCQCYHHFNCAKWRVPRISNELIKEGPYDV